eukprot:Sspe_Gene.106844::Locus_84917_Transcript_1_1_Confidence_1.000_Length_446::g.106844::m.106844
MGRSRAAFRFENIYKALVDIILVTAQKGGCSTRRPYTVYDADKECPPTIPLYDYLKRWMTYSACSEECPVLAYIFIQRCGISLTPLNMHRLLLTGLTLATKWRDDQYYSNEYYAAVGGVSLYEINR